MLLPSTAAERFQLSADRVRDAWVPERTRGVLLASPSNPTGTSIDPQELRRIHALVQERGGVTLVDKRVQAHCRQVHPLLRGAGRQVAGSLLRQPFGVADDAVFARGSDQKEDVAFRRGC